jgi:hypothetical protein
MGGRLQEVAALRSKPEVKGAVRSGGGGQARLTREGQRSGEVGQLTVGDEQKKLLRFLEQMRNGLKTKNEELQQILEPTKS